MSDHYDAIIIGGGAAGLMTAWQAARRGKKVRVLERSNKAGRKIQEKELLHGTMIL